MQRWRVAEAGQRLDAFIAKMLSVSGNRARRLIEAGHVRVDGKLAKKGQLLSPGSEVTGPEPEALQTAPVPQPDAPLVILYEDDRLVVVDKPAGWPSHPLHPREIGTVANALVARVPACAMASIDAREGGLVHRLDAGTSGALVAAKTREAYLALRAAFSDGEVHKTYWALVEGRPTRATMAIEAPLITRGGLAKIDYEDEDALPARTELRVLETGPDVSLVEATAHTGRLHQVRAHLAHLGHPLVGDFRYGAPPRDAVPQQAMLHASSIVLPHPADGRSLRVTAPVPVERRTLWEALLGRVLPPVS